ncbi:hypothetical protein MMC13_000058 [Lambiella insularis]|nr:hypothetical protein [Lambiella insularis]
MDMPQSLDALIIGGGPAGLTAALTLARQRHTAVVFDSGQYRNAAANHIHTVLTWDHKNPNDFRAAARENLASGYQTVIFCDVAVKKLQKKEDGQFGVIDEEGNQWAGKKIILATGVSDIYPSIEGYDDCWVNGIFHCLFCHGYEERFSASSGVLAVGDLANAAPALHFARNAHQITPNGVTIYTDGNKSLQDSLSSALGPDSIISVDSRTIARLEKGPRRAEVILHFSDGSRAVEGFLAHKPKCQLNGDFAQQLGLELTPQGDLKTTPPFYQTSVQGVFTAGDTSSPVKIAPNAMFTGAAAAAGVAAQLQAEALGHKPMF